MRKRMLNTLIIITIVFLAADIAFVTLFLMRSANASIEVDESKLKQQFVELNLPLFEKIKKEKLDKATIITEEPAPPVEEPSDETAN